MPFFDKYPYTNFHNINLDWVLERVKETIAKVAELEDYVTNLDYQEMLNNTINSLIESGTFQTLINPIIGEYVTNWLDDNITEPEGVVIDSSLTIEGACADAKATGDRIKEYGISTTSKFNLVDILNKLEYKDIYGRYYLNTLIMSMTIEGYETIGLVTTANLLKGGITRSAQGYPVGASGASHFNNVSNTKRICYTFFAFPVDTEHEYCVIFNTPFDNVNIAIQKITEEGYNLAINQENFPSYTAEYIYSLGGWEHSGKIFNVNENGCVWFTFRRLVNGEEVDVDTNLITNIIVYRREL